MTTRLAIVLAGVLWSAFAFAELTATVDRTRVTELDLVTLTIRLSNATASENPDFSLISRDFDIVSRSGPNTESRILFSNGQQTSETHVSWVLTLRPKRRGTLIIPPIHLAGEQTRPIEINVTEASASTRRRVDQLVFFDTSVDTSSTYVQGQIVYTVKLFYVDGISGDFPPPPSLPNAVIETIENEKRYESIVNNRRFYVLEKRYAIYPQRSGTLNIPRETFTGTRGRGSFFSARERVSAVSDKHTVEVKPKPAAFTGDHWLPAKSVDLVESWNQENPTFKVGEPVNRTLILRADGLASSLLPPFDTLDIDNAKTYQDPPETNDVPTDDGIVSTLSTTVGIVPTEPGTLTLPEVRIPWWNTETDQMEVATIPEQTFTVAPGTGASVTVPQQPKPAPSTQASQTEPPIEVVQSNFWLYVSLVLTALWLFTIYQWWSTRQRLNALSHSLEREEFPPEGADEKQAFQRLEQACNANDPHKARHALFLWAKARYPRVNALTDLARTTNNQELGYEIERLDALLYSSTHHASSWNGKPMLDFVRDLRSEKPIARNKTMLEGRLNPV